MSLSNVKLHQIVFIFLTWYSNVHWVSWGKKGKKTRHLKKHNLKCLAFCKVNVTLYELPSKYIQKILTSYDLFPTPIIFKNIFIWRNLRANWRKKFNLQKEKGFCNLPTLGGNSRITSTQCVRLKLHIPWSQSDAFKELINQMKKTYTWKWKFQELQLPQATCMIHKGLNHKATYIRQFWML
jgi:hypothetical protein